MNDANAMNGFWKLKCPSCRASFQIQGSKILDTETKTIKCPNCDERLDQGYFDLLKGAVTSLHTFQDSINGIIGTIEEGRWEVESPPWFLKINEEVKEILE